MNCGGNKRKKEIARREWLLYPSEHILDYIFKLQILEFVDVNKLV